MLARAIESLGIPTVMISMMPEMSSKWRLSRVLGVEVPFGQAFGMINDIDMQRKVAASAVKILESAEKAETRQDLDLVWPIDSKKAYQAWQPPEVSPIVKVSLDKIRKARREMEK